MPDPLQTASTLVGIAQARAFAQPRGGFAYLRRGEDVEATLTFAELDRQARAVAFELSRTAEPGTRAVLQYPPGLDFIVGFFGCLYAGLVAVPTAPLSSSRGDAAATARSRSVVRNCTPQLLLSTGEFLDRMPAELRRAGDLAGLRAVATDRVDVAAADRWWPPATGPDDVAYLQYSSGSTGSPKGVVLTHRSVLHNLGVIRDLGGFGPTSVGVLWLPMFHDMGLVAGALMPVFSGGRAKLMSPVAFLQRPATWLSAISGEEDVTSAAPNFAYELCAQRVTETQRAKLDLRGWRLAIVGAERVRAATLERFAGVFGPSGFRAESFLPSYGLAEATLLVSGGPAGRRPVVRHVDREALARDLLVPAKAGGETVALVGSGKVRPGLRVTVVAPETLQPCRPGEVGEICVAGESVGSGYWNAPHATGEAFGQSVNGARAPFLRTGDLGAVVDGELFVSGRRKDLIIVDGRNHYPSDLEATAEGAHPALRPGCCAVVPVDDGERERIVVLVELSSAALRAKAPPGDHDGTFGRRSRTEQVATCVRRALSAAHGLSVDEVVLLRPGSLPFTSSGKLQHFACKARYEAGQFDRYRVDISDGEPDAADGVAV